MNTPVTVIGGGLCGSLAAIVLARRGFEVTVIEKRSDLRNHDLPAGRSINLALANRGLRPLREAGLEDRVRELLTVMRGRMIHDTAGGLELQPYGQHPWEIIYSVSRPGLNALLMSAAEQDYGVRFHFDTACVNMDVAGDEATFHNMQTGDTFSRPLGPTIATDGAGSVVRNALIEQCGLDCRVDMLDHQYKELSIPPADDGDYRMDPNALHIWPRGGYMLIALPNLDRSFTVTLFLPASGDPGFAELATAEDVRGFFAREFPDVVPLAPRLEQDWFANPLGELGTVRCAPWHVGRQVLLLGDAAHAIVPFHGQGMNCAFEDCSELGASLEATGDNWDEAMPRIAEVPRKGIEPCAMRPRISISPHQTPRWPRQTQFLYSGSGIRTWSTRGFEK